MKLETATALRGEGGGAETKRNKEKKAVWRTIKAGEGNKSEASRQGGSERTKEREKPQTANKQCKDQKAAA